LIELKKMSGQKVRLSPHQVSFLTRHRHTSAWILIKAHKGQQKNYRILLFQACQARDLFSKKLDQVPASFVLEKKPFNWSLLFEKIKNG
tara:strand:+ start:558 stop:824 length:267 start_codon:yes stop_codon:yes gene_type:complete